MQNSPSSVYFDLCALSLVRPAKQMVDNKFVCLTKHYIHICIYSTDVFGCYYCDTNAARKWNVLIFIIHES